MVKLSDFDKIEYKKPNLNRFEKPLEKIIGFDSEAYKSGQTFMFCTSLGDVISPEQLFDVLFTEAYASANFVVWNLKYESGAILKILPKAIIKTLQLEHEASFTFNNQKYRISYIPHKCLRIKHVAFQGKTVKFWDMSPFYGRTKLQTAAKEYLKDEKDDIDPNLFTLEYVAQNFDRIASYCIQDCVLTQKLSVLWINKFQETGIPVTSLFSEASISFAYFSKKAEIVTPWEYWDFNKKLLRYAFESYEGGKFEITARGKFTGYEYDISSAYPYEIAHLVDIRNATVLYGKNYIDEAIYGFIRVRVSFSDPNARLPCGLFRKLRVYPTGKYYMTITKQEYDYIKSALPQVKIQILDAAWLIVNRRRNPYKNLIEDLYALKTEWKKKDRLRSNNYKIVMNGFYGKMAQCIPDNDGGYRAGIGWNPLYASIITANTRIAVTELQNVLKDDCLAVHTDSVISTVPIPDSYIGTGLGEFELVEKGNGILVACGIYEINGQQALKGFKKNSIKNILTENPGQEKITLSLLHVESWLQAMAQNHETDTINVFSMVPKVLSLNCDTKRLWPCNVNSTDLLTTLQRSAPLYEQQINEPDFWNNKK